MALRFHGRAPPKKISAAWADCVRTAGSAEEGEREKGADIGQSSIVRAYFGNDLLFLWYEYVKEMGVEPTSYKKLFRFPFYMKTKGVIKRVEAEYAKALQS